MYGQEEKHPEHVRDCPRGPRQVHPDGLLGGQGRYHCRLQGRGDQGHGHQEGRAGAVHHHQVHVSFVFPGGGRGVDFVVIYETEIYPVS